MSNKEGMPRLMGGTGLVLSSVVVLKSVLRRILLGRLSPSRDRGLALPRVSESCYAITTLEVDAGYR